MPESGGSKFEFFPECSITAADCLCWRLPKKKQPRANIHKTTATPRTIPAIAPVDTVLEVGACAEPPLIATVWIVPLLNVTMTGAREEGPAVNAELVVPLAVPETGGVDEEGDRVFADVDTLTMVVAGDTTGFWARVVPEDPLASSYSK